METSEAPRRKVMCVVQVEGSGEKTAKELLRELLRKVAENLTCDGETDKM